MTKLNYYCFALLSIAGFTFTTGALAQDLTGLEIMERMEEFQRSSSDSAFNRMQLSTCKFPQHCKAVNIETYHID